MCARRQIPLLIGTSALLFSGFAAAQAQSPNPVRQPQTSIPGATAPQAPATVSRQRAQAEAGLESPWDVRRIIEKVLNDNEQLRSLLAQVGPQQWYDRKGAPSTYVVQAQTAQTQLKDVVYTAQQFSQKTESLSLALDLYFRLEALEVTARSLDEGAERYGTRTIADKLQALIAHNFNTRERFRDYIRDLAASTEQNFKIADDEAQRCRAIISREPPASNRTKKY